MSVCQTDYEVEWCSPSLAFSLLHGAIDYVAAREVLLNGLPSDKMQMVDRLSKIWLGLPAYYCSITISSRGGLILGLEDRQPRRAPAPQTAPSESQNNSSSSNNSNSNSDNRNSAVPFGFPVLAQARFSNLDAHEVVWHVFMHHSLGADDCSFVWCVPRRRMALAAAAIAIATPTATPAAAKMTMWCVLCDRRSGPLIGL